MAKDTYNNVMSGRSDNNIRFVDFKNLISELGFDFKGQKDLICLFIIMA